MWKSDIFLNSLYRSVENISSWHAKQERDASGAKPTKPNSGSGQGEGGDNGSDESREGGDNGSGESGEGGEYSSVNNDLEAFRVKFTEFKEGYGLEFIDCTNAPAVEDEILDSIPQGVSDEFINSVLKKPMGKIVSRKPKAENLNECKELIINSIQEEISYMSKILDGMRNYITILENTTVIHRYWSMEKEEFNLSNEKKEFDSNINYAVVIKSLLLICNHEKMINVKIGLLTFIQNTDPNKKEIVNAIIKTTKNMVS